MTNAFTETEMTVLSHIQRKVFQMLVDKIHDAEILNQCWLTRDAQITAALRHTIAGQIWSTDAEGGATSYLSDVECAEFYEQITQRAEDLSCVKTIEAIQIAYELRDNRLSRATYRAKLVHTDRIPKRVEHLLLSLQPYLPSRCWLNKICEDLNIEIKSSKENEERRSKFWNVTGVSAFFNKIRQYANTDPRNTVSYTHLTLPTTERV